MAKRRNKKRHTGWIVLAVILVIGAGTFAAKDVIIGGIKTKAAETIGKKLLESQLEGQININGQNVDVSEIIDKMEEEDVEKVTDIAEKYVSGESISECMGMIQDGNVSGLQDYAKENLTQEDKQELQGIYEKYKNQISLP